MTTPNNWLTVRKASQLLGMNHRHVQKLVQCGNLKHFSEIRKVESPQSSNGFYYEVKLREKPADIKSPLQE